MTNRLWQSTLFAVVAGLMTVAFRKNRAQVHYWLWFRPRSSSSSRSPCDGPRQQFGVDAVAQKISVPAVTFAIEQIGQPFPDTVRFTSSTPRAPDWKPAANLAGWALGFVANALIWFRGWLASALPYAPALRSRFPHLYEIRSTPGLPEPDKLQT
jgi:hypothetical protein